MIPVVTGHIDAARIVGRDRETGLIRESIARLDDRGAALLVRGEAGIGKSEVLAYAADLAAAQGARVLRAAGVESETELPFAGLHQLVGPLISGARACPSLSATRCWPRSEWRRERRRSSCSWSHSARST